MRHRAGARWIALLAPCLWMATALGAEADDPDAIDAADEGVEVVPLRQLDVVQNKFFSKEARFEVYPNVFGGITNNHFVRREVAMTGLGLAYHLKEQVYLDLSFQYYPYLGTSSVAFNNLKSLSYALLSYQNASSDPVVVSAERLWLGASVGFSPIYGKINLVAEHVQNLDVSFLAGLGLLQVTDYSYIIGEDANGATAVVQSVPPVNNSHLAGHVGVAARFPLTHWFAVKGDARYVGYVEDVTDYTGLPTTDDQGNTVYPTKTAFASAFMVTAGASFFFPDR